MPPSRTEQVYEAIVDDICTGRLTPGTPLRQELLAERFNVSRQPVQQALLLLRNQGLVREFGRRGLEVVRREREAGALIVHGAEERRRAQQRDGGGRRGPGRPGSAPSASGRSRG